MMRYPQASLSTKQIEFFWICIRLMPPWLNPWAISAKAGKWVNSPFSSTKSTNLQPLYQWGDLSTILYIHNCPTAHPWLIGLILLIWGHQTLTECGLQWGFSELGPTEVQDQLDGTESALDFGRCSLRCHQTWLDPPYEWRFLARKITYKWSIFPCHVWLPEGIHWCIRLCLQSGPNHCWPWNLTNRDIHLAHESLRSKIMREWLSTFCGYTLNTWVCRDCK